jgi:hypothetical protein
LLLWPRESELREPVLPQCAGRKETRKTSRYKTAKRYGSSISLETKQVALTRPSFCGRAASCNGFVSEDGSDRVGTATIPRNESQQLRPAGTRVALPGTNAAHRIAGAAFAGSFVLRFFPRSNEATSRENFFTSSTGVMLRLMTKLETDWGSKICDPSVPTQRQKGKSRLLQTVRKHLHGLELVGFVDLGHLLELSHTPRRFGSQQVTLAGMHSQQLACTRNLKTLGSAAMGLELQLRFRSVAWHSVNPRFSSMQNF